MQKANILPTSADLWRPGKQSQLLDFTLYFVVLVEKEKLQISFINHRTAVRENKVSRSRGSWAINQTSAA